MDDIQRTVRQILENVLDRGDLDRHYRQRLWQEFEAKYETEAGTEHISILPALVCEANGGNYNLAAPVTAAWQLICLAVKLLDDVEDGDVSDEHPLVVNAATGLLFAAQLALDELYVLDASIDHISWLSQRLQRAVLRACAGQHADLVVSSRGVLAIGPQDWLDIALSKSGELLGWAAWAGARVAHANDQVMIHYHKYGLHLGALLQVADDFRDVWHPDGRTDLMAARLTLPVCYAFAVSKPEEQIYLTELLRKASQGDLVAEAHVQQVLIDMGAQAYMLVVGRTQYKHALRELEHAHQGVPPERLVALLSCVFPAVSRLEP